MSNPGAADTPEPTIIEQDGAIPETVDPVTERPEAPVEEPASSEEKPAAEASEEPQKPKGKPWFQERIDTLTRKAREAERERDELKAKLQPAEEVDAGVIKPENFEALIKQEAQRIVQAEKVKARTESWWKAGAKDFGADTFNDKCGVVAAMGAGDSPEFMQIITDPDIIPDGHKVVAALADNPDEAQRILALPPIQMAAALTRFGATATTKAADAPRISSAPAPIKPVGGSAKSSTPEDTDDIKAWMAKRNETARTTAGGYRRG